MYYYYTLEIKHVYYFDSSLPWSGPSLRNYVFHLLYQISTTRLKLDIAFRECQAFIHHYCTLYALYYLFVRIVTEFVGHKLKCCVGVSKDWLARLFSGEFCSGSGHCLSPMLFFRKNLPDRWLFSAWENERDNKVTTYIVFQSLMRSRSADIGSDLWNVRKNQR